MNLLIKKNQRQQGLTLIELIIYLALVSIFISGAITFSWNVIGISIKNKNSRYLIDNLRFVSKKIQYYLRNSDSINQLELQKICLTNNEEPVINPVAIYLEDEAIYFAWGGPSDCSAPSGFEVLTDSNIVAEQLNFTNLSSSDGSSVNVKFNLELSTTGDREEWQNTQSVTSSVELRSN
jgi:prepilin-type N-terminal cleavage/methylation domain-containing protein